MQDSNIEYAVVYENNRGDCSDRHVLSVHKTEEEAIAKCKELVAKSRHEWQSGAPWVGIDSAVWTTHHKPYPDGAEQPNRWLRVCWQFPYKPYHKMKFR